MTMMTLLVPSRWWQQQRQRRQRRFSMSVHVLGILSLAYVLLSLKLYGLKLLTVHDDSLTSSYSDHTSSNSSSISSSNVADEGSYHYTQTPHYHASPSLTKATVSPPNCPIPVYILPQKDDPDDNMHGEHRHFVLDGIEKSPYFELTTINDPKQSTLWIIDLHRLKYQCETIHEQIYEAAKKHPHSNFSIDDHKNRTTPNIINNDETMAVTIPMSTSSTSAGNNFSPNNMMINLTRWTIMFLDWSDSGGFKDPCNVDSILNNITSDGVNIDIDQIDVRYGVRSIVDRRTNFIETDFDGISSTFNKTYNHGWRRKATMKDWYLHVNESFVIQGFTTKDDDQQYRRYRQQLPYQHMSYHVRTDHVEIMRQIITNEIGQAATSRKQQKVTTTLNGTVDEDSTDGERNYTKTSSTSTITWPYETWDPSSLDRPVDVCHMWSNKWHDNDSKYNSEIRDLVSHTLGKMKHSHEYRNKMKSFVGLRGPVGSAGRRRPQYLYAQQLLKCKIVVVVGRDSHEDHYRLMESLSSGAMVLSEPMLRPPPGLVKGRHWDIFTSRKELETMIRYYVLDNPSSRKDIARNGWRFAMESYRSWHFIEKLVSGGTIWSNNGINDPSIESNVSKCFEVFK